jgi:hypothetical protein
VDVKALLNHNDKGVTGVYARWHMFEEKREAVLAIEAAVFAVDGLDVFGSFVVFRFPLQFPLGLMIEFLISAFRSSGFLPKLIGAANNFDYSGLLHYGLSLYSLAAV